MKNKIYFLGIINVLILTIGCLFKIMHWPFAGILIVVGMLLLSCIFIPFAIVSSYKNEDNKRLKPLYILTAIVFSINFISALFKIMHWPYSELMLIISLPLPFVVLLPIYLLYNRNDKEINYKNFMPIMYFFAYFAAISALLALNVSQNVIDNISESATILNAKTEILEYECKSMALNSKTDTCMKEKAKNEIQNIEIQATKICNKIEELKKIIIKEASGNKVDVFADSLININAIKFKDRLVYFDKYYNNELNNEMVAFKKMLLNYSYVGEVKGTNAGELINTEEFKQIVAGQLILVAAIEKLSLIQYQLRFAEYQILTMVDLKAK